MVGGWLAGEVGTSKKNLARHLASPHCLIVSLQFQLMVEPSLAQNYPCSLEKRNGWQVYMENLHQAQPTKTTKTM